jgi:hypothetical protein
MGKSMRRLDLTPPTVLAARRRRAALRRNGYGLAAWALLWLAVLAGLRSWQAVERSAVRGWEARVDSLRSAAQVVGSLHAAHEAKRAQLAVVRSLEAQRPVTGLLAFMTPLLPQGLRLESLVVEPALQQAGMAAPGNAGYFASKSAGVLAVQVRGVARGAAEVAELMRALETCGRFQRAQLVRVDRPPGDGAALRFEMLCEL